MTWYDKLCACRSALRGTTAATLISSIFWGSACDTERPAPAPQTTASSTPTTAGVAPNSTASTASSTATPVASSLAVTVPPPAATPFETRASSPAATFPTKPPADTARNVSPAAATTTSGAAARPAPAPAAALVSSAAVSGEGYRTYLQMPSPVAVGHETLVTVHLEPQAPFKSNDKYPYRFTLGKLEGAAAPSDTVTGPTVTPTRTTLRFAMTPTRVGHGSVSGTFSFSVCTEEKCLVERAPLVLGFEAVADAVSASSNR